MSLTPSESGKDQSPSPHSSNLSLQDYPPLPTSKTSDKKEDASSTKSTKKSLRSRLPFFWKKESSTSLPLDPISPSPPAPSSPSENPESLSSSVQTLQPMTVMHHTPPQPPKSLSGTTRPSTPHTPIPELGPQTLATSQKPQEPALPPPDPLPTYDELLWQVATLRQEKNLCDLHRATMRSNAPSSETESLPTSTSAQVAHSWRMKQPLSTGSDKQPPPPKPAPSTRLRSRPTTSILAQSLRSGSSNTDSIARTRSSRDSLESLSLHGWNTEPTQETATPEEREQEYRSIWHSRRALIPTEVSWTHSEEGQAWMQADPAEQEDILSYSADIQTVFLFNKLHPLHPYQTPAPYQSRFPIPSTISHQPRRRRHPTSPQIHQRTKHMYTGPGRVRAGSGGAEAEGSGNQADIDVDDKPDDGWGGGNKGKKPEKPAEPWKPGTGFFKGDKPPGPYDDPIARDKE
ncbi:uncharacterized protein ARMOST_20369 [Armillaria ostoyae]|uniref:Uncharacterized protein n=1 Tax=Armillaria ostoyae TaxID=47428 RepID=A0A284S765_ARMOS|nr:uncharacterized protein ARMOST_20369 [Armillaria ostoyae]